MLKTVAERAQSRYNWFASIWSNGQHLSSFTNRVATVVDMRSASGG